MNLNTFRIIGYVETLSFLILLLVAMPLKYIYGLPQYVRAVGSIHGGLFTAYVILAYLLAGKLNWPKKKLYTAWVASIIPLGPVWVDQKLLKE